MHPPLMPRGAAATARLSKEERDRRRKSNDNKATRKSGTAATDRGKTRYQKQKQEEREREEEEEEEPTKQWPDSGCGGKDEERKRATMKVGETRRKSSADRDLVLHIRRHFAG